MDRGTKKLICAGATILLLSGCAGQSDNYGQYLQAMRKLNQEPQKPLVHMTFNENGQIKDFQVTLPKDPVAVAQKAPHPGWRVLDRLLSVAFPAAASVASLYVTEKYNAQAIGDITHAMASQRGESNVTNISGSYNTENNSEYSSNQNSWESRVSESFNRTSSSMESNSIADSFQDHSTDGSYNPVTETTTTRTVTDTMNETNTTTYPVQGGNVEPID